MKASLLDEARKINVCRPRSKVDREEMLELAIAYARCEISFTQAGEAIEKRYPNVKKSGCSHAHGCGFYRCRTARRDHI